MLVQESENEVVLQFVDDFRRVSVVSARNPPAEPAREPRSVVAMVMGCASGDHVPVFV